jgi:hypothetical protein
MKLKDLNKQMLYLIILNILNMDIIKLIKSVNDNLKKYEYIELCFAKSDNNIYKIMKIKNTDNLDKYLSDKFKIKKNEISLKRDMYYSQIRDYNIKTKDLKVYIKNSILLDEINYNDYKLYLFNTEYINNDLASFPNLNLYHFSNNINIFSYELNNISIIIENQIIYIKIKEKYDEKFLKEIFIYLQSCL